MAEPEPHYQMERNGQGNKLLPLTRGEWQLVSQIRDIMTRMNGDPFQVSVLVVGNTWHIYEGVHRGKVQGT